MFKIINILSLAFVFVVSCSNNSTNSDETDQVDEQGQGTIKVTGQVEAEHEGISWYNDLRSDGDSYISMHLHINDVGFAAEEASTYSFSIRMLGENEPFVLSTGEYEIGHESEEGPLVMASYTNKEGSETLSYSAGPDASGTVTIHSISDTFVEASYDVTLEAGQSTGNSGYVTVTGDLTAKCVGSGAPNAGCRN